MNTQALLDSIKIRSTGSGEEGVLTMRNDLIAALSTIEVSSSMVILHSSVSPFPVFEKRLKGVIWGS